MQPFTAAGPGYAVIYVPLSVPDLAALTDALTWNVAKQKWLKQAWRDAESRAGHARRQAQAEEVLQRITAAWRQLERIRQHD